MVEIYAVTATGDISMTLSICDIMAMKGMAKAEEAIAAHAGVQEIGARITLSTGEIATHVFLPTEWELLVAAVNDHCISTVQAATFALHDALSS